MSVLICGGAGYIGSHTAACLLDAGEDVIVYDSLIKGHKKALVGGRLIKGDIRDESALLEVFANNDIEAVMNFAAFIEAGESMKDPLRYYDNNVTGSICLIKAMQKAGIDKLIFSSTAAVYGIPKQIPVSEDDLPEPVNAYGQTKLSVEQMLKWAERAYNIKHIALRYFNAAGAHKKYNIGEDHDPETHLIPVIFKNIMGQRDGLKIFGNDYDTPDGTCIRDYIHVSDLADAHYKALLMLRNKNGSEVYNLGNGQGFSNKQIVDAVTEVTGIRVKYEIAPRRVGDPDILIAGAKKAITELKWKPEYIDVKEIIASAWRWHKNNPKGYDDRL